MSQIASQENRDDSKCWLAQYRGEFFHSDGSTRLGSSRHFGPLRVQRPFYPEGRDCLHLYLLHPPGGLVGGDKLSIELDLKQGSHVLMTTPSAGKLYRNISGFKQCQCVQLTVDDGACLEYLPQENIVFNGADGELHTQVDLKGSGVFVGWEITCLGRTESNDMFEQGQLRQSLMIRRDGQALFSDRLRLEAPGRLQISRAGFQASSVFGTFVITKDVTSIEDASLEEVLLNWQNSQVEGVQLAITQKPGVFIARALGDKSEKIKEAFEVLWQRLRPELIERSACPPRIWRT